MTERSWICSEYLSDFQHFISQKKKPAINNAVLDNENVSLVSVEGGVVSIPIERLTALSVIESKNMAEITDQTVIARITQTLPTVTEKAAKTVANQAVKNAGICK